MKSILPNIIGDTQHAFIKNRNISSNIRFIYDTLVYTEENRKPGMILSIDFEKAFDSISWSFLHKTLDFLNFGPEFVRWIRTLYSNIKSCISVNGQNTDWFEIQRGVRQGDPCSPYLYLVCAEVLSLMIKGNALIKGIQMSNNINLLSQFADDTTLSLDGSEQSLKEALKTITEFSHMSGLKINEDKTMIVWIGASKGSNLRFLRDRNFIWDPGTSFKIIGILFSTDIKTIPHLNYKDKLDEMKRILQKWKKRQISPLGKITIIKSLVISKITHLLLNLPDPDEIFLKKLEKELFGFLWDDKPSKIKKTTICKEYSDGGIKMINIRDFLATLKISWLRKLGQDINLKENAENCIKGISRVLDFGVLYSKHLKNTIKNQFWKDVLTHYVNLANRFITETVIDFMYDHIFYNPQIQRDNRYIFVKEWADNNIIYIHQLCKDNQTFYSYAEFRNKYIWSTIDFLTYQGIINSINEYKRSINFNDHEDAKQVNKLISLISSGNKTVQKFLNRIDKSKATATYKWDRVFNNIEWTKVYNKIYITTKDVQLRWFQYRLINRIIPTERYLYITKIKDDPICSFCQEEEQNICHLFFECNVVFDFWMKFERLVKEKCIHCNNVTIDKELVILGHKNNFMSDTVFDFILLLAKFYIYKMNLDKNFPTLENFVNYLKKRYVLEKYVAGIENNAKFEHMWRLYKVLIT